VSALRSLSDRTVGATTDYSFSNEEYDELVRLIKEKTGIHMSCDKHSLLQRRLAGRLQALGVASFGEYCVAVRASGSTELEHFINAVTTNLTAFFRESHHFEYLAGELLPQLVAAARRSDKKIRLWCAGCSTGEEPYSIAMLVNEMSPQAHDVDIKILATDLDSSVVAHCMAGVYAQETVAKIPAERLQRWFSRGKGKNQGYVRISPQLQEMIAFRQFNLLQTWPMSDAFDVIFCRNVIIYFDKATQSALVGRFAEILNPDGYLFLGHSESLLDLTDSFSLLGKSIYQKESL